MGIIDKVKRAAVNIMYGLPFGMKAADKLLTNGGEDETDGVVASQEVSDERVGMHLIKGEVTQQVEELRYRTYKVEGESKDYKYLGNGVAVKESKKNGNKKKTRIRFVQENKTACQTVLETLKQVGSYGTEKYSFEIDYSSFVRFRVEKFATRIEVDIDEEEGSIETTLFFNTEPNPYDAASMPFINELSKLEGNVGRREVERNEIASSILNISFTTFKAYNEDDFTNYSFVNGGRFKSLERRDGEFAMTLEWDEYMRLPLDLESKYYSKTMADKYRNKERKDVDVSLVPVERKRHCSICGKEMSVYDGDIQEANGDEPVCSDCMRKAFESEQ